MTLTCLAPGGCRLPRTTGRHCQWHGDPRAELPDPSGHDGASSVEVCAVTGITYRQLDYWTEGGLIGPSLRSASGSGTQRGWSDDDIDEIRVIKNLLDRGLSLQAVRRVDKDRRGPLVEAMAAVLDSGLRVTA